MDGKTWALLFLALLAGAVVWTALSPPGSSASAAPTGASREVLGEVEVACEAAVSRQLVSPSSMRTQPVKDPRPLGNGKWEYGLVIDSQNRFGAMIRSVWRCSYSEGSGRATVEQLE